MDGDSPGTGERAVPILSEDSVSDRKALERPMKMSATQGKSDIKIFRTQEVTKTSKSIHTINRPNTGRYRGHGINRLSLLYAIYSVCPGKSEALNLPFEASVSIINVAPCASDHHQRIAGGEERWGGGSDWSKSHLNYLLSFIHL